MAISFDYEEPKAFEPSRISATLAQRAAARATAALAAEIVAESLQEMEAVLSPFSAKVVAARQAQSLPQQ